MGAVGRIALLVILAALIAFGALIFLTTKQLRSDEARGFHGQGHGKWHENFYKNLKRPDEKDQSCCSLNDCTPTQVRMSRFGYYEVMVEGEWILVPLKKIVRVSAPDGGAHVCYQKRVKLLYCVILPPET